MMVCWMGCVYFHCLFSGKSLPSLDYSLYIHWTLLDHYANSPCLLRSDEGTSGSSERIIDNLSPLGGIENEFSKEWNRFHSWVNGVLANFGKWKDALGFASIESMGSMPTVGNKLMLWKIIKSSDNSRILHPYEEL